MKIAMPVDEKVVNPKINNNFGRTPYFAIYETETKAFNVIDNSGNVSQGGAGIKAAQELVNAKVEAVIVPQCGENAAKVLRSANITIYKMLNDNIVENVEALKNGKLEILDKIHSGYHGGNI